jgi:arylsulfatase
MGQLLALIVVIGIVLIQCNSVLFAQASLPKVDPLFTGTVDIDTRKSVPGWPQEATAPEGAPNIVLILVDDVGFSTSSTFGGPVQTPNFSKLAAGGLRYNEFQVNALCSPTRASLLTGRNAHQIGFGTVAEWGAGYPGYNTLWPKDSACAAEVLKDDGYSTAAFGKWHNTPMWQVSPAGPFDRWPTGFGFEYFYGFISGADNQYYPRLFRDTTPVEPPSTPAQGYDLNVDLANDAIRWLREHDAAAGSKPFFIYYATGATHSPHQVPQQWLAKYKGDFNEGWDRLREQNFVREQQLGVIPANAKLTPRPQGLPSWDSLTADEKKLLAHQAEVYAGYAAQTDYEIGRVLQEIDNEGKSQNTIVIWIFGDNGASAQGGLLGSDAHDVYGKPKTIEDRLATEGDLGSEVFMNHFAAAWAWAFSSPFKGTKTDASHLGGTRDPMVISWPAHIKMVGGLRSQFSHVTDIVPTLYDVVGINTPKLVNGVLQAPLEGVSMVYTFDHPNEPSHHHVQYFESLGNRAIYKDGWWAGDLVRETWEKPNELEGAQNDNVHPWELYDLNSDFSQADDLAGRYPDKLKELQQLFDEEGKRNHVYPLMPAPGSLPTLQDRGQITFTYREGVDRLTSWVAPVLAGRAYSIIADVNIPPHGANGVIIAQGGRYGGFTLFVKDNRVVYEINSFGNRSGRVVARDPLTAGRAHIVVNLVPDEATTVSSSAFATYKPFPGIGTLRINGKPEGSGRFENVNANARETLDASETLDVGSDLGSPVSPDYQSPNRFTGNVETVTLQLKQ